MNFSVTDKSNRTYSAQMRADQNKVFKIRFTIKYNSSQSLKRNCLNEVTVRLLKKISYGQKTILYVQCANTCG